MREKGRGRKVEEERSSGRSENRRFIRKSKVVRIGLVEKKKQRRRRRRKYEKEGDRRKKNQ